VLSGPNLHRLGKRQPEIYGTQTLEDIHALLSKRAQARGVAVICRQTNYEGQLVEWIGAAEDESFAGMLLNPGALTHSSYALYDALLGAALPAVELHLSNPEARESFRHHSTIAGACVGRVSGFGARSYLLALDGLLEYLGDEDEDETYL
jgi:3-dehydroquinate dehydratase-2